MALRHQDDSRERQGAPGPTWREAGGHLLPGPVEDPDSSDPEEKLRSQARRRLACRQGRDGQVHRPLQRPHPRSHHPWGMVGAIRRHRPQAGLDGGTGPHGHEELVAICSGTSPLGFDHSSRRATRRERHVEQGTRFSLVSKTVHGRTWAAALRRHEPSLVEELIARSPVRGIELPEVERRQPRFLTTEQLERELAGAVPVEYRTMIFPAGVLGLRWSEAAAATGRCSWIFCAAAASTWWKTVAEEEGVADGGRPGEVQGARYAASVPRSS